MPPKKDRKGKGGKGGKGSGAGAGARPRLTAESLERLERQEREQLQNSVFGGSVRSMAGAMRADRGTQYTGSTAESLASTLSQGAAENWGSYMGTFGIANQNKAATKLQRAMRQHNTRRRQRNAAARVIQRTAQNSVALQRLVSRRKTDREQAKKKKKEKEDRARTERLFNQAATMGRREQNEYAYSGGAGGGAGAGGRTGLR
jgi:hypothetical protein